jgi:hypothetical protein
VDARILLKQFGSDPGRAFLEMIRTAPGPVRAVELKREIVDAGAGKSDVDRLWKRLQPMLKLHPRIRLEKGGRYAWSAESGETRTGEQGWAGKEFEKARLVADLAMAIEVLRRRGDTLDAAAALFEDEARRKRLWPIGRPGETVAFDPGSHEAEGTRPETGATVEVVRSGYVWHGGGEPLVAAKAVVAAQP